MALFLVLQESANPDILTTLHPYFTLLLSFICILIDSQTHPFQLAFLYFFFKSIDNSGLAIISRYLLYQALAVFL